MKRNIASMGAASSNETPVALPDDTCVIVTCEHGGHRIPAPFQHLFAGCEQLLFSHRGYDAGALALARRLSRAMQAPLVASTISRLLIDLNRSPGHRGLYSEMMRTAPRQVRDIARTRHYLPYREKVEHHVHDALAGGRSVVHISCHSFTPILDGRERNADVGFLYDPASHTELSLCLRWITALQARAPELKLRRNYPYSGRADGLCAWLRRRYSATGYLGIELELNQRHFFAGAHEWQQLCDDIIAALQHVLNRSLSR